jgi:hypothetical protein
MDRVKQERGTIDALRPAMHADMTATTPSSRRSVSLARLSPPGGTAPKTALCTSTGRISRPRSPADEYEYFLTIPADQIPTLTAALGSADADIVDLLEEHGENIVLTGERSWFRRSAWVQPEAPTTDEFLRLYAPQHQIDVAPEQLSVERADRWANIIATHNARLGIGIHSPS